MSMCSCTISSNHGKFRPVSNLQTYMLPFDRRMKYGMLLVPKNAPTWGWWRSVSDFMRLVFTVWGRSVIPWSWSANSDSHHGVWQAGHKSRLSFENDKTLWSSIPTTSFIIVVYIPYVIWCIICIYIYLCTHSEYSSEVEQLVYWISSQKQT